MDVLDTSIRNAYKTYLVENNALTDLQQLESKKITEPIFTIRTMQAEEEPVYYDVAKNITEIALDMSQLDTNLIVSAGEYETLMTDMNAQLDAIEKRLDYEKERLQDTNMICGNISEFTTVKPLNSSIFSGQYFVEEDGETFSCYREDTKNVAYTVISVTGNGESGNAHVQAPEGVNLEKTDTRNIGALQDQDLFTAWEYNRLETTNKTIADKYSFIDSSSQPLRCTITLYSETQSTLAAIYTEDTNLVLEDIQISVDGEYYTSVISEELVFNNKEYIYDHYQYIYSSGLISYSPANYIRLTFRSQINTDDNIINEDGEILEDVVRKVISLQEIVLYDNVYAESQLESQELISSGQLQCAAIFANVYIPFNFPVTGDYVTMSLTVNGTAYPLVPINGNDKGDKIIRYNPAPEYQSTYAVYISEPITSAILTIHLKPYNQIQTPFVGHIKFCAGIGSDSNI